MTRKAEAGARLSLAKRKQHKNEHNIKNEDSIKNEHNIKNYETYNNERKEQVFARNSKFLQVIASLI